MLDQIESRGLACRIRGPSALIAAADGVNPMVPACDGAKA
jgi:hypothetical protein